MDFSFTLAQEELIARAATVARELLAPRAAGYDESRAYPHESWNDLWRHGFLGMAIPQRWGGLGLDMPSYVAVLEALAQGCTNATMTLHMHSVVQMYIDALATPAQKSLYYPEVIEQGKLFGSWGSEPERSLEIVGRATLGVEDDLLLSRHAG